MFTGIIEEIGTVKEVDRSRSVLRMGIEAERVLNDIKVTDSISVNGACLTVVDVKDRIFGVEIVEETVKKTNLDGLRVGSKVNLERAMQISDRLGGHLVQGHVDGVGKIIGIRSKGNSSVMEIEIPHELSRYTIAEGAIAIDGVSMTVAKISANIITIAVIPHTLQNTTLGLKKVGESVNLEVDMIGKYIEKISARSASTISEEWLRTLGY